MIRPININLNAAHPELPLVEATTFTGAPSSVFIRGVPPNCGRWAITAVFVAASFPDGSTTTRAAVQSANGVWVATLPATATSGRTANGVRIMADGIDENGEAVTGYILGVADFAVASLDVTPAPEPGETSYQMLYFDAVPSVLHKCDVAKIDGVLKFYNGTAWEPFAAPVTLDDAVTRTSGNGVKSSGIWSALWGALAALPTGFTSLYDWVVNQLAGKASTADATLTERGFGAWVLADNVNNPITGEWLEEWQRFSPSATSGEVTIVNNEIYIGGVSATAGQDVSQDGLSLVFNGFGWANLGNALGISVGDTVATRTALHGYQLGSQTDKPLASEAEAVALRTGKMSASATGANILVGGSGGAASSDIATAIEDLFRFKADLDSPTFTGTPVAPTPQDGDNSALVANTAFVQGAVPYALVTKTISNGAVSLDDRAINAVAVSSSLASLTINFPTATSGKARDFGLRLTVASGITTAPELVLPQGVTCENADGEAPEIGADGAATILYFTETASGVFLVKGEVLQTITQA